MWRARLTVYLIVAAVAATSYFVQGLSDPGVRSFLGIVMNLSAIPAVEIVLRFLRHEAEAAARSAARDPRVRAARRSGSPQAPDPLR